MYRIALRKMRKAYQEGTSCELSKNEIMALKDSPVMDLWADIPEVKSNTEIEDVPEEFLQPFHRFSDENLRNRYKTWVLQKANEGYTAYAIARAVNRKQPNISKLLLDMGFRWHARPRRLKKDNETSKSQPTKKTKRSNRSS